VVTDLGTEFGVEVKDTGSTNVYVSVGEVSMVVKVGSAGPGQEQRLLAGEAARCDGERLTLIEPREVAQSFVYAMPKYPKNYGELPVLNPGFEWLTRPGKRDVESVGSKVFTDRGLGVLVPSKYTMMYADGTRSDYVDTGAGWQSGLSKPSSTGAVFFGGLHNDPDEPTTNNSSVILWMEGDNELVRQTLKGVQLRPSSTYQLSVDVGRWGDIPFDETAYVKLCVSGMELTPVESSGTVPEAGQFINWVQLYRTSSYPPLGDLQIHLGTEEGHGGRVLFDNVKLFGPLP